MLLGLDNMLRDHLLAEVGALAGDPQRVRFQPPDDDLLTAVRNLNAMALSLYLVEVRENRGMRSNARTQALRNGDSFTTREPDRLECHYVISAWSPAQPSPAVEPALDEHQLLYDVATALFRHSPLRPSRVYPVGAPELALWGRFGDEDLPMQIAPPEGYHGLGDFWNAMGTEARWRPTVHLTATIPVELAEQPSGPIVLTRFADYRQWDAPDSAEVLIQIGGHVVNDGAPGGASPLPGVFVNLEDPVSNDILAIQRTDSEGRFTFERLRSNTYRLRTRGIGLPVLTRDIQVPANTGEYDLRYP